MKTKDLKRQEAKERQAEYDALTLNQRLTKIGLRFGTAIGAEKERDKILKALVKLKNAENKVASEAGTEKPGKVPYQKPKRS